MNRYIQPLHEGCIYHIFNQGNNRENLFYNPGNYEFFLKRLDYYLSDFIDIYCLCLLPNHFHLLIRVKEWSRIEPALKKFTGLKKRSEKSENKTEAIVSEQFRRFFISYGKSVNKQQFRSGSLFRKYFKRLHVQSNSYFRHAVVYIHRNPQEHGIVDDFKDYPWSSYSKILEDRLTKLKKREVLDYFADKENYIYAHSKVTAINTELEM